jgi:hypothetical protein
MKDFWKRWRVSGSVRAAKELRGRNGKVQILPELCAMNPNPADLGEAASVHP